MDACKQMCMKPKRKQGHSIDAVSIKLSKGARPLRLLLGEWLRGTYGYVADRKAAVPLKTHFNIGDSQKPPPTELPWPESQGPESPPLQQLLVLMLVCARTYGAGAEHCESFFRRFMYFLSFLKTF